MRVFEEKQWFNQWWVSLINFSVIGLLLYFLYEWYIAGNRVDKVASDDYLSQIVVILMLLLVVGFMFFLRLKTSIDEIGVHFQFIPFHRSTNSNQ